MALPELLILDVGHGNCAVLRDTNGVAVIDCAPGSTLKDALEQLNITEIHCLLISHADQDHLGGLIALLNEPKLTVHHIYLNADAMKRTKIWEDVRIALRDARRTRRIAVHTSLTTQETGLLDIGKVHVEVLAPTPELALGGVGGTDLDGQRLSSNSMSAVLRLKYEDKPVALIAGDLDSVGLKNLLEDRNEIQSEILVFPHHGGKPGNADPTGFAAELCSHVKPNLVLFSIARSRTGFPRPDIIEGIKAAFPDAHIACTQLSRECATNVAATLDHLMDYPAKGREGNSCCAGTILIKLGGDRSYGEFVAAHRTFVASMIPTLCMK